jgi:hypothetical protein
MKLFFALLLTVTFQAHAQGAANCDEFLQAYTSWEIKLEGRLVPRLNFFDIPDWDPNSQFDGVVLTASASKSVKRPVLEIDFKSKSKSKKAVFNKAAPLTEDANLLTFPEFKPKEFFTFEQAGSFEVRLKDGDTVVCRYTRPYYLGH